MGFFETRSHCAAQTGFQLQILLASTSQVLGLQVYTIIPTKSHICNEHRTLPSAYQFTIPLYKSKSSFLSLSLKSNVESSKQFALSPSADWVSGTSFGLS
jgi:hypothetical protein